MRVIVAVTARPVNSEAPGIPRLGFRRRLGILTTLVILAAMFGAATGYFVREDMPLRFSAYRSQSGESK